MALDGAFLHEIAAEIESAALGARIDKIAQPSREEIILHLHRRGGGGGVKLLLCAGATGPRIHFTNESPENPKAPPMFCMLLRKHLSGAKLAGVRQVGLDRILFIDFEAMNELGDMVTITIVTEIMGRHSNIIILNQDGKVIDSIKRVDFEMSSVRQILPGMSYVLPPMQDKLNLIESNPEEMLKRLDMGRDIELSKALMEALQGVSPILCREIAHYTARGAERGVSQLSGDERGRLSFFLGGLSDILKEHNTTPTIVEEPDGRPKDFSFITIRQYGTAMRTREFESVSGLLDAFYSGRDRQERTKQRASDLLKLLANISERTARKLAAQHGELEVCAGRENLRIMGDLVTANLHQISKGSVGVTVQNFYDPDGGEIEIKLDPQLTPVQNAQRYYALYRKADTAEKMLRKLIVSGEEESAYIDSVFDALTRADGEKELDAIRRELEAGGYVRSRQNARGTKPKREEKLPPLRYRSTDGFTILTGRNNIQNDRLTLKESRGSDIWLHTQKIPGSHTVIITGGVTPPNSTIEQAAVIAAYNSKARESGKIPVDFTAVKNVSKPNGAKPGMVIYDHYRTVIVDPDEHLVKSLEVGE